MTQQILERHQVFFYLGAVMAGIIAGSAAPSITDSLDQLL